MKRDIGDELVPVITPNYDSTCPIKANITVSNFLDDAWIPNKNKYYLHQWQFPLSKAKRNLCYKNEPLPAIGMDILQVRIIS